MSAVEAELVCKGVQALLRDTLVTYTTQVKAEWASPQILPNWIVPADDLDLPAFAPGDIQIGRVDVVLAESNFPALYIWAERELPLDAARGEQNFAGEDVLLFIRVIVNGTTVEETQKLAYRYTDAIRRCLMTDRTLKTVGLDMGVPDILYASSPDDPLYKAAQMETRVKIIVAW